MELLFNGEKIAIGFKIKHNDRIVSFKSITTLQVKTENENTIIYVDDYLIGHIKRKEKEELETAFITYMRING
jgi:hypothetical protein